MKIWILSFALLLPLYSNAATACGPCQEVDKLAADWAITPPEQSDEISSRSSRIMKELRTLNQHSMKNKVINPEIVHAIVATLGIIYLHDDDPLDDELTHLRSLLTGNKAWRAMFDQEFDQLPPEQKAKLAVGVNYIDHPTNEQLHKQ